jgi:hypothetical protein
MLTLLLNTFLIILIVAGMFCTLLGMLTVFHWFKTPKMPADDSNRLNNIASWWIGLTRPNVLATSYAYFKNDLLKNINKVENPNN